MQQRDFSPFLRLLSEKYLKCMQNICTNDADTVIAVYLYAFVRNTNILHYLEFGYPLLRTILHNRFKLSVTQHYNINISSHNSKSIN